MSSPYHDDTKGSDRLAVIVMPLARIPIGTLAAMNTANCEINFLERLKLASPVSKRKTLKPWR